MEVQSHLIKKQNPQFCLVYQARTIFRVNLAPDNGFVSPALSKQRRWYQLLERWLLCGGLKTGPHCLTLPRWETGDLCSLPLNRAHSVTALISGMSKVPKCASFHVHALAGWRHPLPVFAHGDRETASEGRGAYKPSLAYARVKLPWPLHARPTAKPNTTPVTPADAIQSIGIAQPSHAWIPDPHSCVVQ